MGTSFDDFIKEIEEEARTEGTEAVEHVEALRAHFRIGRQLAMARRAAKLTQAQAAARAGLDQGDVSRIERGNGNPTFNTLAALAQVVGMEIDLRPRRK